MGRVGKLREPRECQGRGIPLSVVIARYFAYVFLAIALVWLCAFVALSAAINSGAVYSANYGHAKMAEVGERLSASPFDARTIPSAFRYAHLDANGTVVETDLNEEGLKRALLAAKEVPASFSGEGAGQVTGNGGATYAAVELPDGGTCVLVAEYFPEFVSIELRNALPNPQNIMLIAGCIGSVVAVALIARRASSVIARKMEPLTSAAERISREDLDFAVGSSNVRQINDVLASMDKMRASLKDSLEARWRIEREQRDQVASLAHDLKTPLTVIQGNVDYIAEVLGSASCDGCALGDEAAASDGRAPGDGTASASECAHGGARRCGDGGARERSGGAPERGGAPISGWVPADEAAELAAALADTKAAAARLNGHVQLLIDSSCNPGGAGAREAIGARELASALEKNASMLGRAAGIDVRCHLDARLSAFEARVERASLERAVENLIDNAIRYAEGRIDLSVSVVPAAKAATIHAAENALVCEGAKRPAAHKLLVEVKDDGPGFSAEALKHGRERFFRDDASRSSSGGNHFGIGLHSAFETARAHDGSLTLENATDPSGNIAGALASLWVPVFPKGD